MPDVARMTKGRPIASRSSSSGSSVGQRSIAGRRPAADGTSSATRSRLVPPRAAGTKSHSFMRPTAASVNKGSIPNLPKSIKAMVK